MNYALPRSCSLHFGMAPADFGWIPMGSIQNPQKLLYEVSKHTATFSAVPVVWCIVVRERAGLRGSAVAMHELNIHMSYGRNPLNLLFLFVALSRPAVAVLMRTITFDLRLLNPICFSQNGYICCIGVCCAGGLRKARPLFMEHSSCAFWSPQNTEVRRGVSVALGTCINEVYLNAHESTTLDVFGGHTHIRQHCPARQLETSKSCPPLQRAAGTPERAAAVGCHIPDDGACVTSFFASSDHVKLFPALSLSLSRVLWPVSN